MGTDVSRRDFLTLVGGVGALCAFGGAFSVLNDNMALAAGEDALFEDGVSATYSVDDNHSMAGSSHHLIAGLPSNRSICPHCVIGDPASGTHKFYDLDSHPEFLSDPRSGHGTPRHTPEAVLRMWKIILWFSPSGPGYSWRFYKSLGHTNENSYIISQQLFVHWALSYYWVGLLTPTYGEKALQDIDPASSGFAGNTMTLNEAIRDCYAKYEAEFEAHPFDMSQVQIMMMGNPGNDKQEIIYWRFRDKPESAHLRVSKKFDF